MNAHTEIIAADSRTAASLALEIAADLHHAVSLWHAIDVLDGINIDTTEANQLLRGQLEDTAKIASRLHEMLKEVSA